MQNKGAFTLVELIVVITILAILGIIAFISFTSYSAEARDSKRLTDVRNLFNKISIYEVKGGPITNILREENKKENKLTINSNQIIGYQGFINYEVLLEKEGSFLDPSNSYPYPIAYAIKGSQKYYQLATINESHQKAVLVGSYYQMKAGDSPSLFTQKSRNGINIPDDYIIHDLSYLPYYLDDKYNSQYIYTPPGDYIIPSGVSFEEPSLEIGCQENQPDIIFTLSGQTLRLAGCNAYDTLGIDETSTISFSDTNGTHFLYLWTNGNTWCKSRGWRLPTKDEYNNMIGIFGWQKTNSSGGKPYSGIITKEPYNLYPAGYYNGEKMFNNSMYGRYWVASTNDYPYFFEFSPYQLGATSNGYKDDYSNSIRCIKDEN